MSESAAPTAAIPQSDPHTIAARRDALVAGLAHATGDTLHDAALAVLAECGVDAKRSALQELLAAVAAGHHAPNAASGVRAGPDTPGRPARPALVPPKALKQRRLGSAEGRAALLHAVAHIEFNAINLALDAVQRFTGLPPEYYADWLSVADDEARHFELLTGRLQELGFAYGDFPAHDGLWQMARVSADAPLVRMALVPRLLEARGLDVTPPMMARLIHVGDQRSADCLAVILAEEVRHVAIGSRWYAYLCDAAGLEPQAHFARLLSERAPGAVRSPLNEQARLLAGFSESELQELTRAGTERESGTPNTRGH
ncbi:MAG: ferritin-like domain-containing protein [Xanthomonadales bacterium]|nr:ferritin-like domain-containing protein [Xanthomonadales bacterium]